MLHPPRAAYAMQYHTFNTVQHMLEHGWYTMLTYATFLVQIKNTWLPNKDIPKEAKGIEGTEESKDEKISFSNTAEISP